MRTDWGDESHPASRCTRRGPGCPALAVLGGVSDFPTDLIYFFRATQILRALTQHLGLSDEVSIAQEWGPHARRLLRKRGRDPRNWRLPDADQGAVVVREAS